MQEIEQHMLRDSGTPPKFWLIVPNRDGAQVVPQVYPVKPTVA